MLYQTLTVIAVIAIIAIAYYIVSLRNTTEIKKVFGKLVFPKYYYQLYTKEALNSFDQEDAEVVLYEAQDELSKLLSSSRCKTPFYYIDNSDNKISLGKLDLYLNLRRALDLLVPDRVSSTRIAQLEGFARQLNVMVSEKFITKAITDLQRNYLLVSIIQRYLTQEQLNNPEVVTNEYLTNAYLRRMERDINNRTKGRHNELNSICAKAVRDEHIPQLLDVVPTLELTTQAVDTPQTALNDLCLVILFRKWL